MIDFNDKDGRLIVALQVDRKTFCVYVQGKWHAEFHSGREALACARSLAANGQSDSSEPPSKSESDNGE